MKIILTIALLAFSALASAGSISQCTGGSGDYSDAPSSYGVACHDTNRWQQLGWDRKNYDSLPGDRLSNDDYKNRGWTPESSAKDNRDRGDNGVKWAVSSDGENWSEYNTKNEITQGQYVKFQVGIKRSTTGNHQYDQAKIWMDWFGAGSFANAATVFNLIWAKDENSDGVKYNGRRANAYNRDLQANNSPDFWGQFFSSAIQIPLNAVLGETWLRARVICENSLTHANNFQLLPTGYYHQGEVEDYAVRIAAANVSEPSVIMVLSLALIGFVARRKIASRNDSANI